MAGDGAASSTSAGRSEIMILLAICPCPWPRLERWARASPRKAPGHCADVPR